MTRSSTFALRLRILLVAGASLFSFQMAEAPARAGEPGGDPSLSYSITTQGSSITTRGNRDSSTGNVYVYVGGRFPTGTHFVDFQYVFDIPAYSPTGYLTPLLFENTAAGIYTVRGIGVGHRVKLNSGPQTIPFVMLEGEKIPINDHYTFGFINSLVDIGGVPILTSEGVVDFDYTVDAGDGLGGSGTTNEWGATNYTGVSVVLGSTFGSSGADYAFLEPLRSYSASVAGVVVGP